MSRAGRKRKQGRRHPSGKLVVQTQPAVNYRAMAALQPHRRGLPEKERLSEKAECLFGRMRILNAISGAQYLAGQHYASVVGAYLATIERPRSVAGSGRGYECGCTREMSCDECSKRKREYNRAFEALSRSGRPALMAVNSVVLNDEPAPRAELICGLNALGERLGFTSPGKSRTTNIENTELRLG